MFLSSETMRVENTTSLRSRRSESKIFRGPSIDWGRIDWPAWLAQQATVTAEQAKSVTDSNFEKWQHQPGDELGK